MSQDTSQDHISHKRVLFRLPGADAVVPRSEEYTRTDAGPMTIDLYYPPSATDAVPLAAVLFVTGYSDIGAQRMLGCKFKAMGAFVSWAQLTAASGLVGMTYENSHPYDVDQALDYIREHADEFGIDARRIGVWACSGHVPNALSLLMERGEDIKCAAFLYGYTLDVDGATDIADMAAKVKFVTVAAEKVVEDLPRDVPLWLVRAGQDGMPGLNHAFDRFVSKARAANLPMTVVDHATAPHAFDLLDDSAATREVIKNTLAFLQHHLANPDAPRPV